jgi:GGDEF domain-containing protein
MSELIHDPLTGLMTPFYFYESARRLQAWASRREQPLALISIKLSGLSEDEITRCAHELTEELRGGDLLARIGREAFALLLLGDLTGANHLIFRLEHKIKPRLDFNATQIQSDETLVTALERLEI